MWAATVSVGCTHISGLHMQLHAALTVSYRPPAMMWAVHLQGAIHEGGSGKVLAARQLQRRARQAVPPELPPVAGARQLTMRAALRCACCAVGCL